MPARTVTARDYRQQLTQTVGRYPFTPPDGGSNRLFLVCRVDLPPLEGPARLRALGTTKRYPYADPAGWEGCIRTPICVQLSPTAELAYYDMASPLASGHAGTRWQMYQPPFSQDIPLSVTPLPDRHPLDKQLLEDDPDYCAWAAAAADELQDRFTRWSASKQCVASKEVQARKVLARIRADGDEEEYFTQLTQKCVRALAMARANPNAVTVKDEVPPRTSIGGFYRGARVQLELKRAAEELSIASPGQIRAITMEFRDCPRSRVVTRGDNPRSTASGRAVKHLSRLAFMMDIATTDRLRPVRILRKDAGLPPINSYQLWTQQGAVASGIVQRLIDFRLSRHPSQPFMTVREVAETRQAAMREALERHWMLPNGNVDKNRPADMPAEKRAKRIADWFIPLATTGEPHAFTLLHDAVKNPSTGRLLVDEAREREATRRAKEAEEFEAADFDFDTASYGLDD